MTRWPYMLAATERVERHLEFARLPDGWAAVAGFVLLGLLLAAVAFFYLHEQRSGASRAVRRLLLGLRCSVILLLAAIWLEPILATYLHRRSEAHTLVLVDASASMSLADRYRDPEQAGHVARLVSESGEASATDGSATDVSATDVSAADISAGVDRWSLVKTVLSREDGRLLHGLAQRNSVWLGRFGATVDHIGRIDVAEQALDASEKPTTQPSDEPDRVSKGARELVARLADVEADMPATDLGRAVREAVESTGGNPVAAIVIISDGRFNRGEPVEVIAQYARDKRIAVYTVGIGDPSPPRNVAVAAVEAPANVFVQDPFKVTGHLRAEGMDGETLTVELLERGGGDASRVVETKQVEVPPGGQLPPVEFNHRINEAAEDRLGIRIVPREYESVADDNIKETTVRALANKMRVLIVAGGPSWEYRYLSRLLERDKTADVSCWLQSADIEAVRDGNTVIDRFPTGSGELAEYDCIVLMDPQPGDISASWAGEVGRMVSDRGCGLLYVAGRKNTPRLVHNPDSWALLNMLPVVFDPGQADLVLNELGHFQRHDWSVAIPPAAVDSNVLAMTDRPEQNAEVWSRLGGVYWHYPVRREKPVATVLLRHSNPAMHNAYGNHILLATQFVGSGRTGYLAFDSTWRWRRYGDAYFNRFWIQLLRHMVEGKLLSGQRRGFVQVDQEQGNVGEPAVIEARLLDASYQPMSQPDVPARITVEGADAGEVKLQAQANRPGWYRGRFVPIRVGTHTIRIDLPNGDAPEPVSIRGEVRVGRPDVEFRNTSLDREALELLAGRSDGGKYLNVDEVDSLAELIPGRVTTLVLTGQPTSIWDGWWTMALLVALLGLEWTIRKRVHML